MANISVSLPSDGETVDVADYNTPINTIVNEINGSLDNSNITAAAAIAGSKLADASVPSQKLSTTVGFYATSTADINATPAVVTSYTEIVDYGSDFASGVFTAPVAGMYNITAVGRITNVTADNRFILFLYKNTSTSVVQSMGVSLASTHDPTATIALNIPLAQGDTLSIWGYSEAGTEALDNLVFSGYLVGRA